jgi:hypothetical protein
MGWKLQPETARPIRPLILTFVITGLDPVIQQRRASLPDLFQPSPSSPVKDWMAGSGPAMTKGEAGCERESYRPYLLCQSGSAPGKGRAFAS